MSTGVTYLDTTTVTNVRIRMYEKALTQSAANRLASSLRRITAVVPINRKNEHSRKPVLAAGWSGNK
jgi:hypothetical protein